MKLVPGPLPPIPSNSSMERLAVPLPFSPDSLLWRNPFSLAWIGQQQPPNSPLFEYKSQLPSTLASDPRVWSREDVVSFLRWAEREFDLQPIDLDMFQMNGKAICLLTRTDLAERAPSSGDVLYNVLQILVREANNLQRMLPSSPVTPTSRVPNPFSPHSHPPTPNWNILAQNSDPFHQSHAASLAAHLMAQNNSVTLSPAPSVDSQAGSPQHADNPQTFGHISAVFSNGGSNGSGSNPSDSDEDGYEQKGQIGSPPNTPSAYSLPPPQSHGAPRSPKENAVSPGLLQFKREFFPNEKEAAVSPGLLQQFKREFFPNESPEPNTNGRLLWDFLQQLLNDPSQRYTNFIAWKNRDTGVFKIVDPAGLAKLWGIQKNHLSMNYDKMSRALRYYYRVNILRKVQGERHCYQFLRNPTELKNIKNISLLRQMSPTNVKPPAYILQNITIKPEPIKPEPMKAAEPMKPESMKAEPLEENGDVNQDEDLFEEKPTDLSISMDVPTDLSSSSRHVNIICSPDPPIPPQHH